MTQWEYTVQLRGNDVRQWHGRYMPTTRSVWTRQQSIRREGLERLFVFTLCSSQYSHPVDKSTV